MNKSTIIKHIARIKAPVQNPQSTKISHIVGKYTEMNSPNKPFFPENHQISISTKSSGNSKKKEFCDNREKYNPKNSQDFAYKPQPSSGYYFNSNEQKKAHMKKMSVGSNFQKEEDIIYMDNNSGNCDSSYSSQYKHPIKKIQFGNNSSNKTPNRTITNYMLNKNIPKHEISNYNLNSKSFDKVTGSPYIPVNTTYITSYKIFINPNDQRGSKEDAVQKRNRKYSNTSANFHISNSFYKHKGVSSPPIIKMSPESTKNDKIFAQKSKSIQKQNHTFCLNSKNNDFEYKINNKSKINPISNHTHSNSDVKKFKKQFISSLVNSTKNSGKNSKLRGASYCPPQKEKHEQCQFLVSNKLNFPQNHFNNIIKGFKSKNKATLSNMINLSLNKQRINIVKSMLKSDSPTGLNLLNSKFHFQKGLSKTMALPTAQNSTNQFKITDLDSLDKSFSNVREGISSMISKNNQKDKWSAFISNMSYNHQQRRQELIKFIQKCILLNRFKRIFQTSSNYSQIL